MTTSDITLDLYKKSYPEGLRWDAPVPVYPVFDMLEKTAKEYGDRPAFDFLNFKMTWNDVYEQSLRLARSLQDRGIGKGRTVGIFLPN